MALALPQTAKKKIVNDSDFISNQYTISSSLFNTYIFNISANYSVIISDDVDPNIILNLYINNNPNSSNLTILNSSLAPIAIISGNQVLSLIYLNSWTKMTASALSQSFFSGYISAISSLLQASAVFKKYNYTSALNILSNSGEYSYSLAQDYCLYTGPSRTLNINYTISIYLPSSTSFTMNFRIYVNGNPIGQTLILENDGSSNITTGSLNVLEPVNTGDQISLWYTSTIIFSTCNFSLNISGV